MHTTRTTRSPCTARRTPTTTAALVGLPTATMLATLAAALMGLPACVHEVGGDEVDAFEPIDLRDNVDVQGLYDCTESRDTGYRAGDDFPITVVRVDARPVEVDTANAYIAMQRAAASAGVPLRIVSGFRTMDQQEELYRCYQTCSCNNCNLAARPGHSNHQSGHALDLNTSDPGVLSWLNANAGRFGFSRTVPSEPWHWEWWGDASDHDGPCGVGAPGAYGTGACVALPAEGGTIDDGDDCFEAGGPSRTLRAVDEGHDADLVWTGVTANANAVNYAAWNIALQEAGEYAIEVYVQGELATSRRATYAITHAGVTNSVMLDQSGANRWVPIGSWSFNAGGAQRVRLNDNTGESAQLERKLVFDAVRLRRIEPPVLASCPWVEATTGGDPLNVRPLPNTERAPLATMPDGVRAQRVQTVQGQRVQGTADWHRVEAPGFVGYVSGAYASCRDGP